MRANAYNGLEQYDRAILGRTEAIERGCDSAEIYIKRGGEYLKLGREEEAERY